MAETKKKFIRVWNPTVFTTGNDIYDFCHIEDITESNGYELEDIKNIDKLELGEVWQDGVYSKAHTIIRIN